MRHKRLLISVFLMVVSIALGFNAITVYAEDVSDNLAQGIGQYEKGDFQKAIKDLTLVVQQLREKPEDPSTKLDLFRASLYLGLSYLGTGQEILAKEAFRDAVLAAPGKSLDQEQFSPKVISLYNEVVENTLSALSIESNVTGAEAFLDDHKQGIVPVHIRNLLPGEYTVKVVIGNQKTVRNVTLEAGKDSTLVADFPNLGFLSVTSDPSSAGVFLEKREVGMTPLTKQVPSGEYSVVVSKEGYEEAKNRLLSRQTRQKRYMSS